MHTSRALGEPLGPLRAVLEEALAADEVARHDKGLYEELGRILRAEDPMAAVDLYCSFPFSSDLDFGQNALRLAAIKTLLAQKAFDDVRLKPLLISLGKGFGVRQVRGAPGGRAGSPLEYPCVPVSPGGRARSPLEYPCVPVSPGGRAGSPLEDPCVPVSARKRPSIDHYQHT